MFKIWQILKRFAGTFCRAQPLKLGGVVMQKKFYQNKLIPILTAALS